MQTDAILLESPASVLWESRVTATAVGAEGRILLFGHDGGSARACVRREDAYVLSKEMRWVALNGNNGTVRALDASPHGRLAITGGDDRIVRVFDLGDINDVRSFPRRDGRTLAELKGHAATILAVRFSPDGHLAVSVDLDGMAYVWDVFNQRHWHRFAVIGGSLESRRKSLLSSTPANRLRREADETELTPETVKPNLLFTSDGWLGVVSYANQVLIYDVVSGQSLARIREQRKVSAMTLVPGEKGILLGMESGDVSLWQLPPFVAADAAVKGRGGSKPESKQHSAP